MANLLSFKSPEYQLHVSRRARHMRIKVTPLGEIQVVIPVGMDPACVPEMLEKKQAWLQAVLKRIKDRQQAAPLSHSLRPDRVELTAINEVWKVNYVSHNEPQPIISQSENRLTMQTDSSPRIISGQLRVWLQQRARQILPAWLQQTSEELDLAYNKVQIRGQKTRWGSCSSRHTISLNRNLLLMPAATVRYLFIHELCHTRHMNHSQDFWQLVAKFVPEYKQHENQLREATRCLPLWAYV